MRGRILLLSRNHQLKASIATKIAADAPSPAKDALARRFTALFLDEAGGGHFSENKVATLL
jgi:hypothetical protein